MKNQKLEIVSLPIDCVKEYENNVKVHTVEQVDQIKKSISEFGNCDPIAVDENNVLICGHGRIQALRELGFDTVQAVVLKHLSEDQKRAYRLVHNKLTMNTGFDLAVLQEELQSIHLDDLSIEDFGFTFDESVDIESFFEESSQEEKTEEEAPEGIQCPHCKNWFAVK